MKEALSLCPDPEPSIAIRKQRPRLNLLAAGANSVRYEFAINQMFYFAFAAGRDPDFTVRVLDNGINHFRGCAQRIRERHPWFPSTETARTPGPEVPRVILQQRQDEAGRTVTFTVVAT